MKTLKTISVAFLGLAMLSGAALAGKESCITRTLSTNYNDGLNGAVSTVCYTSGRDRDVPKDCEAK